MGLSITFPDRSVIGNVELIWGATYTWPYRHEPRVTIRLVGKHVRLACVCRGAEWISLRAVYCNSNEIGERLIRIVLPTSISCDELGPKTVGISMAMFYERDVRCSDRRSCETGAVRHPWSGSIQPPCRRHVECGVRQVLRSWDQRLGLSNTRMKHPSSACHSD